MFDISEEFYARKERRRRRRNSGARSKARLLYRLRHSARYRPSIWEKQKWDGDSKELVCNGVVSYSKNSNIQRGLKRRSNSILRNISEEEWGGKSNRYRRYFDYWWEWV